MTSGRDFSILFLETKSNLASNVTGALPTRLTAHQPPDPQPPFPKHHLVQLHSKKPGSILIWYGLWPRSGFHWAAAQWPRWSSQGPASLIALDRKVWASCKPCLIHSLSWPQLQGKRQLQFICIRGLLDTQLQNRGHHSKPVDIVIIPGSWHAFPCLLQGITCTVTPRTWFGCSAASKSKVGGKTAIFQSIWHKHLGICMPTEEDLLIRLQGTNPKGPFIDPGGHQAKLT